MSTTESKVLYTAPEAAKYLRISLNYMRTLGYEGRIPTVNIGRRRLFRLEDLNAYINESVSK
jgi:excisionase family DNA binding protein